MPSLYEGFPLVLVEAQASGLTCFISKDVIPDEVKINSNVYSIPLESDSKKWADIIINTDIEREESKENFEKSGFIIQNEIKILEDFYINEI